MIARAGDSYHFVADAWFGEPALRFSYSPLAVGPRDAVTRAALAAPSLRGLRGWLRFPVFEVHSTPDGHIVTIRDVRFSRGRTGGLGTTQVRLDRQLRPR